MSSWGWNNKINYTYLTYQSKTETEENLDFKLLTISLLVEKKHIKAGFCVCVCVCVCFKPVFESTQIKLAFHTLGPA